MNRNPKKIKILIPFFLSSLGLLSMPIIANAEYWLVIGSYRQGPGSKPHVSGITSPSLFAVPAKNLELCQEAGRKINSVIYRPVWQFDNKWTCIYTGK
tara:strand:- start:550 stop:843 length:294 start_codon:yes stop_codon:yes gene_type:complete